MVVKRTWKKTYLKMFQMLQQLVRGQDKGEQSENRTRKR
jgi:hypothetical protein